MLELETERLRLRPPRESDLDDLVTLDSDPEVMRFISRGAPTPREHLRDVVLAGWIEARLKTPDEGTWIAETRGSGDLVGWFHMRPFGHPESEEPVAEPGRSEARRELELGYRLARARWGEGLASEGSGALIRAAFERREVCAIVATTLIGNRASLGVMERCGLLREAPFQYAERLTPGWTPQERRGVRYRLTRDRYDSLLRKEAPR